MLRTQAEGNFQTTKFNRINKNGDVTSIGLKYSFHIGLHLRDIELLKTIQSKLNNIGKIYEYIDKEEAHLAVYKVEELKWIIENIFSLYPLLTTHQRLRFEQLRKGIISNLKRLDSLEEYHNILVDKNSLSKVDFSKLQIIKFTRATQKKQKKKLEKMMQKGYSKNEYPFLINK